MPRGSRLPVAPLLALLGLLALPATADPAPAGSLLVRAYEFDRGNVAVYDVGHSYADTEPVLVNGGQQPNTMEYDIDFPVTAEYTIMAKYTAVESRPVDIFVDDELIVRGLGGTTGSWQASQGKWEKQADRHITAGKHTVTLVCAVGCIPHIAALRFDSPVPFPEGWRRKPVPIERNLYSVWSGSPEPGKYGYHAYVRDDGFVDAPADYDPVVPFQRLAAPAPRAERILEYLLIDEARYPVQVSIEQDPDDMNWSARLSVQVGAQRTDGDLLPLEPERIRRMLQHVQMLIARFAELPGGKRLPEAAARAEEGLAALAQLEALPDNDRAKWEDLYGLYVTAYRLKHEVALQNPLLDFGSLVFAKRQTYDTSHIYTTYFDGSHRYGGGLYVLSPPRPDGSLRRLASELGDDAIYRDPDVSFDGERILFSYKPDPSTPCRIYEVRADGSDLRNLTYSDYDDIDPCYLPGGRIMFVSTRCRRVVLCHNAFTVSVLHTMDGDGGDVRCVSYNTVNDFTPSVLSDGRVAYTRWEYVDKNLGNNQSAWIVNPDGSRPVHIAGEHWGPITFWEPRQIPNSPKLVCTLGPHMPIAAGPIAIIDPADSCASPAVYESLTPELPPPTHFRWLRTDVGYYCNPYPLSEDFYLVSYTYEGDPREPRGYALYLLDCWNNRDLIYRDPDISSFEAFPLAPRPRPAVIPETPEASEDTGTFCLLDVYRGLPGTRRGEVKYLRIIEEVPKPVAAQVSGRDLQYPIVSNHGHLAVKRLWGTVPVEEDGSAYFRAPADTAIYFSALDENLMEIQRMRAFTQVKPGETLSCVGCHEERTSTPAVRRTVATAREVSDITPPPDGVRAPDFAYDVQPALNRNCIACHGGDKPAGGLDLSPHPTNLFNVAYENLTERGYVSFVYPSRSDNLPVRPPKFYGSHASRMVQVMRGSHRERLAEMPAEDFERIVTWIDCNAPYYGTYVYSRPGTLGGRELITPPIRRALAGVYERRCVSCHQQDTGRIERIAFHDPESSPALLAPLGKAAGGTEACGKPIFESRDDPDAQALLAALDRLKQEMADNPREDMLPQRPPITDPDCRYVYRP